MSMFRISFIAIFCLASCRSTQVVNLNTANLSTRGPVAVDVQTFGGTVTIIADPTVSGTVVSANQYEEGVGAVPVAKLYMKTSATVEKGPLGETVHVVATCDDDPLRLVTANIVIRSNTIHGVRVINGRGDVTLQGISGAIDIKTRDGNVRIVTPLVMNEAVTVENRRGNIVYRVRSESRGIIDATAINGEATLDLRQGNAVILPGSTGDHLSAVFNKGTNQITMRTVDGNARIFVVPDPIGSEPFFDTEWISW
ncbi:MAG: hypothetical protein ISR75_06850 [Phycisphaerales bacterium]|nr:hypothetical protein [Phycisphaerales bacterium]